MRYGGEREGEEMNKCEYCRYWLPDKYDWSVVGGECRRNAPIMFQPPIAGTSLGWECSPRWPRTQSNDWCGAYMVGDK